jgi:zinc/manganese transport system substrate-binding protein
MSKFPQRLDIGKVAVLALFMMGSGMASAHADKVEGGATIQVVAAENFWGSLVSQVGGSRVNVVSVLSDPNADPHEYESNADTAKIFTTANYVILNGAGYDSWCDKLLSAGTKTNRKVLNVADFLGKKNGDNPHFWYNPDYVNQVISQMEQDLISIDPSNAEYYKEQLTALQKTLVTYQNRAVSIKNQFGKTPVASTESIFVYPAASLGLDLVSPAEFMDAIDEGNDPPVQSVVKFEGLIKNKKIQVLVYNEQTVTPITETIKKMAADAGIPVIGITETIQPPDASFEDWMNGELMALENALNAKALGK